MSCDLTFFVFTFIERPTSVFLQILYFIAPFLLLTHCSHPPSLIKQAQSSIFREFYLKKSVYAMVSSSM